ncbi:MAG: radical SAM protein [Nitrospira sp.]|nr:radical SAM protein [bacterium]MBL7048029.1 radical SAM protein [Nitrospira sp.]
MDISSRQKLTLVNPNSRWFGKRPWVSVPFAALILTALLKDEFELSFIDANGQDLSEDDCARMLAQSRPDVILISALSVEYHRQVHALLAIAKKECPDAVTVVGGVYPTVLGEEVLRDKNVDYIFIGHAEERLPEFIHFLNNSEDARACAGVGFRDERGEIVINPVKTYIADVKKLQKPDYSLIDLEPYIMRDTHDYQVNSRGIRSAPIITTYGCPHNCLFCATRTISGRGVIYRPVEDVLEEIEFLMDRYNIEDLAVQDDLFLSKRSRITELLQSMIDRKYNLTWNSGSSAWDLDDTLLELMKKSGCAQISMSVESGSPHVLKDIIRKPLKLEIIPPLVSKCKELGIDVSANFVIGFPGETWEDLRMSFRFAEECDFDLVHFHVATPLPKTDLYTLAKESGVLPDDFSFLDERFFGFGNAFISTDEFTAEQLKILRAYEWDRINFSTPEKTAKVASMYDFTMDELKQHRKKTLLNAGVYF